MKVVSGVQGPALSQMTSNGDFAEDKKIRYRLFLLAWDKNTEKCYERCRRWQAALYFHGSGNDFELGLHIIKYYFFHLELF